MELTPDDVRDVLRVLDSSGLDELHLELADLSLTVRREARPLPGPPVDRTPVFAPESETWRFDGLVWTSNR